ncbi:MAG: hypothetical protein JF593_14335 [Novosphingobium sp.]|nr:hypothetical protein [Novosphingobium sp.]
MMKAWPGVAIAVLLLPACQEGLTPQEQARQDARDVAKVEAINHAKPPPSPLDPQSITAADIEQNKLYGPGCGFVARTVPGGDPIVLTTPERATLKLAGKFVTLAADKGGAAMPLGTWAHYVGKEQSLTLARAPGDGTAPGLDRLRWDGQLTVRDDVDQIVFSSAGTVQCGS